MRTVGDENMEVSSERALRVRMFDTTGTLHAARCVEGDVYFAGDMGEGTMVIMISIAGVGWKKGRHWVRAE